jgi:hypothetical protein
MNIGLEAALNFNLQSEPQLEFAQWLECNGVDLARALNVGGPIVEHDIMVFPRKMFDFVEPDCPEAIRAVVHVALGWERGDPDRLNSLDTRKTG